MVSEPIPVLINGFGRIGRCAARILMNDPRFRLVGINDIYSFTQMRSLLEYDSVYGAFDHDVSLCEDHLLIGEEEVPLFNIPDPANLPLAACGAALVLECSGYFLTLSACTPFLKQGAKRVVVSTPPKDEMPVFIRGVNDHLYDGEAILSASSCSASAIVPLFSVVDEAFGIRSAMLSMYHSYTSYQQLLDNRHYSQDVRRTRSATQNIIPLQSSAAGATAYFFPHLRDRLYAKSIRIPLDAVTFYDLTLRTKKGVTHRGLLQRFHEAASGRLESVISVTQERKVSSDYIADPHRAVLDAPLCTVQDRDQIRLCAWQDNEYGYVSGLIEIAALAGRSA